MSVVANSSVRTAIVLPLGVDSIFTDLITKNNNQSVDIESAKFYMRSYFSRTPFIDESTAEVIKNNSEFNVKIELSAEELATEGENFAWWSFRTEENEYQTPEFPIIISDHGPGVGVKTGAIVDGVSNFMPITVDALKKSPAFGERRVQRIAELIQLRVLNEAVPPDEEIVKYELPLLDYFSKRVALELCTPGIDYWARQIKTATTQGPTEVTSFPDMIQSLEKLKDNLVIELEQNWRELAFFVPELKQRKAIPMPGASTEFYEFLESNGNLKKREIPLGFVTKNPSDMQRLQTGWRGNYDTYTLGFFPYFP